MNSPEYRIIVSLGTDYHRFDRLVHWIDHWLGLFAEPPSCLVQHGSSIAPQLAKGIDRMPRSELLDLYRDADLVVVQGGPGSILDAREAGHIPVAVPRLPQLDEVVDAHQLAFTKAMQERGEAVMATRLEELILLGEAVLRSPGQARTVPRPPGGAEAAGVLGRAVTDLVSTPPQRHTLRRLRQVWLRR
ncbi:glycosyl transferase [Arthrobacter sp. zg-Y859]|uniref:Glycosyl transferase n=1 Tax=Arthrobacter jinronghuae TaxID=2964609 RepID=A0ABT1NTY6_9MICC|nr:glycosyltransferase [Arthrobacter jinronghuae]MCC9175205.1 glycosyl transferase [Arthrobacter sp. zg-Y179]MCQ1951062.1 glycosyl transferase [Arthrobacter jinronghuae]UWX79514.1 glycosyl transferase [Arthrobacter jinronghuae]